MGTSWLRLRTRTKINIGWKIEKRVRSYIYIQSTFIFQSADYTPFVSLQWKQIKRCGGWTSTSIDFFWIAFTGFPLWCQLYEVFVDLSVHFCSLYPDMRCLLPQCKYLFISTLFRCYEDYTLFVDIFFLYFCDSTERSEGLDSVVLLS